MTTPTLPPLPDEDGYIPILIAGRQIEVNGYRNSTMEAYGLAAYQAGKSELRELIADDAYAASFQTMGQYRQALLKIGENNG